MRFFSKDQFLYDLKILTSQLWVDYRDFSVRAEEVLCYIKGKVPPSPPHARGSKSYQAAGMLPPPSAACRDQTEALKPAGPPETRCVSSKVTWEQATTQEVVTHMRMFPNEATILSAFCLILTALPGLSPRHQDRGNHHHESRGSGNAFLLWLHLPQKFQPPVSKAGLNLLT